MFRAFIVSEIIEMSWQGLLQGFVVIAVYAIAGWRLVKANTGNKVIECGVISLVLVFAAGAVAKSHSPNWVMESIGTLMLLMCVATVGLFARECYQAIRRRLVKSGPLPPFRSRR
jgi:nucleoside recognition membrane protein YjiH